MYKDKGTSAGFNSAKEDAQNKKEEYRRILT